MAQSERCARRHLNIAREPSSQIFPALNDWTQSTKFITCRSCSVELAANAKPTSQWAPKFVQAAIWRDGPDEKKRAFWILQERIASCRRQWSPMDSFVSTMRRISLRARSQQRYRPHGHLMTERNLCGRYSRCSCDNNVGDSSGSTLR